MADTTTKEENIAGKIDKEKEEWRPIPGWEKYYAVSSLGRVKSLVGINGQIINKILKQHHRYGYQFSPLIRGKRKYQPNVHHFVCLAFHGLPPTPDHQVAHFDGNKKNNRPSNLRWATPTENSADSIRLGTTRKGEKNGNSKLTADTVLKIRRLHQEGMRNVDIEKNFSLSHAWVHHLIHRNVWRHI